MLLIQNEAEIVELRYTSTRLILFTKFICWKIEMCYYRSHFSIKKQIDRFRWIVLMIALSQILSVHTKTGENCVCAVFVILWGAGVPQIKPISHRANLHNLLCSEGSYLAWPIASFSFSATSCPKLKARPPACERLMWVVVSEGKPVKQAGDDARLRFKQYLVWPLNYMELGPIDLSELLPTWRP